MVGIDGFDDLESTDQCNSLLNISPGEEKSSVAPGRLLRSRATAFERCWEIWERPMDFGKYCRSSPFGFSLVPRCQGLWGSQNYTGMSVATVNP
jgi:hypothetical protein